MAYAGAEEVPSCRGFDQSVLAIPIESALELIREYCDTGFPLRLYGGQGPMGKSRLASWQIFNDARSRIKSLYGSFMPGFEGARRERMFCKVPGAMNIIQGCVLRRLRTSQDGVDSTATDAVARAIAARWMHPDSQGVCLESEPYLSILR